MTGTICTVQVLTILYIDVQGEISIKIGAVIREIQ